MQVAPGRDHCRQLPALSWADTITWLSWGIGKKMQKIKFWALGKLVLVKRYQANSWLKRDHCHQIPSLASQTKLQKYFRTKYFWVKKVLVGWPLLGLVLPTSNGNGQDLYWGGLTFLLGMLYQAVDFGFRGQYRYQCVHNILHFTKVGVNVLDECCTPPEYWLFACLGFGICERGLSVSVLVNFILLEILNFTLLKFNDISCGRSEREQAVRKLKDKDKKISPMTDVRRA